MGADVDAGTGAGLVDGIDGLSSGGGLEVGVEVGERDVVE